MFSVVHYAEEFGAVGKSPVIVASKVQAGGEFLSFFESHFSAVVFLPCEACDMVGNGTVAIVGEVGVMRGEVCIFTEGLGVAGVLAGIWQR